MNEQETALMPPTRRLYQVVIRDAAQPLGVRNRFKKFNNKIQQVTS